MNKKSAHFGLSFTLLVAFLAGCASGDFSRTRPVALPAVYPRDEVTYENRWVNGSNEPVTFLHYRTFFSSNSTVSELSFVYVQWNQAVTLFPVIEACEFVTLQTPFAFMQ